MTPLRRAAMLALLCALACAPVALTGTPAAAVPPPPSITARAWIITDLDTGQIIAARDPHRRLAPASTLKTLTLLALSPAVPVDGEEPVRTATDADAGIDGSRVGLVPGSLYRPVDLYHGLMLGSGNDCAHALAEMAGGQDAAVSLMRAEALRLGAVDTVVHNTSGLDAKGQVSSPYDLALFGRAVLADPGLAPLVATTSYDFPAQGRRFTGARPSFQIQNHNYLLRSYPGALGVKNGYTVAAGGSFIGAARRGKHAYLVTLLKAKGNTWYMARDLLDWAFAHGPAITASGSAAELGRLVTPEEVDPATGLPPTAEQAGADIDPASGDSGDDAVPAAAALAAPAGPADGAGATGPGGWAARLLGAAVLMALLGYGFALVGRYRLERAGLRGARHSS